MRSLGSSNGSGMYSGIENSKDAASGKRSLRSKKEIR